MPRTPYQTTPFTIDPSARSTQTFAERYGVSPPHSNENLYGNDYTIVGSHDNEKFAVSSENQTRNHKVDLSKTPCSSNIIQQPNNNNNGSEAFQSTVIKGSKSTPNNTHSISTSFDVEQRQVQVRIFPFIFSTLFSPSVKFRLKIVS